MIGHDPIGQMLHGDGAQRRILRRLPHDRIAAHAGDGGIPRPDGDRKIEGGDHADDAQRMPLLEHAMRRPLRGIVRPYSWRDRPTAKSQMSIISCTSP